MASFSQCTFHATTASAILSFFYISALVPFTPYKMMIPFVRNPTCCVHILLPWDSVQYTEKSRSFSRATGVCRLCTKNKSRSVILMCRVCDRKMNMRHYPPPPQPPGDACPALRSADQLPDTVGVPLRCLLLQLRLVSPSIRMDFIQCNCL